jgi:hypothetical protein
MMSWQAGNFYWAWYDWLGLVALLIATAFFVTVIAALRQGVSPLKLLASISKPLLAIFKIKPK